MTSKKLDSILASFPAATVRGQNQIQEKEVVEPAFSKLQPVTSDIQYSAVHFEEVSRLVAEIPRILKDEIKNYIRAHKGETEKGILLKALKKFGFNIKDEWLIDKRTTR